MVTEDTSEAKKQKEPATVKATAAASNPDDI